MVLISTYSVELTGSEMLYFFFKKDIPIWYTARQVANNVIHFILNYIKC